jgi:hypothetical protein
MGALATGGSGRRCLRAAALIATVLLALALPGRGDVEAARPFETEDTGTTDVGQVEVELSGEFARVDAADAWVARLVVAGGAWPGLEARFESTGVSLDLAGEPARGGVGDSLIGLKYRLLDEDEHGAAPAVMAALALRLPTARPGLGLDGVDVVVLAGLGKTLGPFTLNVNAGYTFFTAIRDLDAAVLAASLEYRPGQAWTVGVETVNAIRPRTGDTSVLRTGATWTIHRLVRLDGAVGFGLTRLSPDVIATFGVTLGPFSLGR